MHKWLLRFFRWGRKPESKVIGWCETPNGFMVVDECPVCFEKFRFHGTTTARNDLDKFREDFELRYFFAKCEMRFNDYQNIAHSYGIYPVGMGPSYLCLGLAGETGEVCDKIKKVYRDKEGEFSEEDIKQIEKELGDVLWYLSELSHSLGIDLGNVASENISKLENRRKRNTIHGSGDDR